MTTRYYSNQEMPGTRRQLALIQAHLGRNRDQRTVELRTVVVKIKPSVTSHTTDNMQHKNGQEHKRT